MKGWTSTVYEHFGTPIIDNSDPVIVKYIFHCKMYVLFCSTLYLRIGFVSSTDNWIRLLVFVKPWIRLWFLFYMYFKY